MDGEKRAQLANNEIQRICHQYGVLLVPRLISEFVNGERRDVNCVIAIQPDPAWKPEEKQGGDDDQSAG